MPHSKRKKILVVEDDTDQRRLLKAVLESAGYFVHTAFSGEQAVAALGTLPFDLMILDMMLSGAMDGLEVLARLKANPATTHVPVMIVSAYLDEERIKRLLSTGAELYMTKPYHVEVLMKTVDHILEGNGDGRLS